MFQDIEKLPRFGLRGSVVSEIAVGARRRTLPLVLAVSAMVGMSAGPVAAASYNPAYHADYGADCWLGNPYGININYVTMYAINATNAVDWQGVGWIPALYKYAANGTWSLVEWGTWRTGTTSETGRMNVMSIGLNGGGSGPGFSRSDQGYYRVAIWYRWFARPEIGLAQQDRFEWLAGPYYANGVGVALYPYCNFTQGTMVIGG
jgi:hypothetical protein